MKLRFLLLILLLAVVTSPGVSQTIPTVVRRDLARSLPAQKRAENLP